MEEYLRGILCRMEYCGSGNVVGGIIWGKNNFRQILWGILWGRDYYVREILCGDIVGEYCWEYCW